MSDYLDNLVARSLHRADVVQPRLTSRFEPSAGARTLWDPASAAADAVQEQSLLDEPASDDRQSAHASFRHGAGEASRSDRGSLNAPTALPADEADEDAALQPFAPAARPATHPRAPMSAQSVPAEDAQSADDGARVRAARIDRVSAPAAERVTLRTVILPAPAPFAPEPPRVHSTAASQPDAGPVVKITIGRVDVRAVMPAPPAPRSPAARREPALSLEDYLKTGGGNER